jgi:hypothetical protein
LLGIMCSIPALKKFRLPSSFNLIASNIIHIVQFIFLKFLNAINQKHRGIARIVEFIVIKQNIYTICQS